MERSELEKASQSDLVELVLKQHVTFLKVQATNQQLVERVHELEKALNRPKKTSKNSSSRPSSDRKGKQKSSVPGKKSGPKVGHSGQSRARSKADVSIECKVETCLDCGSDLSETAYRELGRSQVVEIPPVKPVVVEAIR